MKRTAYVLLLAYVIALLPGALHVSEAASAPKLVSVSLSPKEALGGTPVTMRLSFNKRGVATPIFVPKGPKIIKKITLLNPKGVGSQKTAILETKSVTSKQTVEIQVIWGSVTRKKKLTLTPAPKHPLPKGWPSKTALLAILENGGISGNLDQAGIDINTLPRVPVASFGSFHFVLNPNESIAQMIARLRSHLASNPQSLNPQRWRVRTVSFKEWLNMTSDHLLEEGQKALLISQRVRTKYNKVVVVEDRSVTARNVLAQIKRLAPNYALDIHVLCHGGHRLIAGHETKFLGWYWDEGAKRWRTNFFDDLKRMKGKLHIRSVYQMNCRGGTLVADWKAAGARVVNGTPFCGRDPDAWRMVYTADRKWSNSSLAANEQTAFINGMPPQYTHFMNHWLSGKSFNYATAKSYEESKLYMEPILVHVLRKPMWLTGSKLNVSGDKWMTISWR